MISINEEEISRYTKPYKEVICKVIDWVLIPLAIFVICYDNNYANGLSYGYLELGQHLGYFSELYSGKIPYRDIFTLYGPLSEIIPALFLKVFGETYEMMRFYFHFTSILGLICSYFLARKVLSTGTFAYLAAFILIVDTYTPNMSSEWGGIRFGLGALVLLFLFLNDKKWFFVAGAVNALSFLYSAEVGAFAILASTGYLFYTREGIKWYIYGFIIIMAPVCSYLIVNKAFYDYLTTAFWLIPFNHIAISMQEIPQIIPECGFMPEWLSVERIYGWLLSFRFKLYLPAFIFTYAALSFIVKKQKNRKDIILLALLIFGLPLYLTSFRSISGPQFRVGLMPAVIIGFVFLENTFLYIKSHTETFNIKTVTAVIVLSCGLFYIFFSANLVFGTAAGWFYWVKIKSMHQKFSMEEIIENEQRFKRLMSPGLSYDYEGLKEINVNTIAMRAYYLNHYITDTMIPVKQKRMGKVFLRESVAHEIDEVSEYIMSHTVKGEPIFAFPDMGLYYFLTERPSVTRFPLPMQACIHEKFKGELLKDLRANPPRYIIFSSENSGSGNVIGKKDEELLPEILAFIKGNYHVEKEIYKMKILKRNN
jgi:hypothetical protein